MACTAGCPSCHRTHGLRKSAETFVYGVRGLFCRPDRRAVISSGAPGQLGSWAPGQWRS